MTPTFRPKQVVLCYQTRVFREGQVVVAFVDGREVIKRIQKIQGSKVWLVGDNLKESTDSRSYGSINDHYIEGVVFFPSSKKKD